MKKKFTAPTITKVVNEEIMAGVCNEKFVYTSTGGVTSNGHARVCYHFRWSENSTQGVYYLRNTDERISAVVIDVPAGATFVKGCHDGKSWGMASTINPGWADFEGTNGTCHFAGDIILADGTWINKDNVYKYTPKN